MEFVTFTVINPRGDRMQFCLEARKADIIIEKVYNMGTTKVVIDSKIAWYVKGFIIGNLPMLIILYADLVKSH